MVERSGHLQRWYLVHTKPCGESLAREHLQRQGYETYLPRVSVPAHRRGEWREKVVALFPRYLFLRLNEGEQELSPVRSTIGVSRVVCFGSRYAIVPDRIVGDLQLRADAVSGLHRLSCPPWLAAGTPVRITAGVFDGLEGIFERDDGTERVVVLLNLLGHGAPVCVASRFVMPARAA